MLSVRLQVTEDEERCEAVKRIFVDVLQRGNFEHIIMITHLGTIKQSWHSNELAVEKLDGKMSTVISVAHKSPQLTQRVLEY